jgi:hypothetical protein
MDTVQREPTPPHHPTHRIHFHNRKILDIVSNAQPGRQLLNVYLLPPGQSFNNKIHFLNTSSIRNNKHENTKDPSSTLEAPDLVLKVSGKFFGPDKVQNEVSALWLLEKHCPNIPVPRVIAWNEGERPKNLGHGSNRMIRFERENFDGPAKSMHEQLDYCKIEYDYSQTTRGRGWILMTKRPGRRLQKEDLEGEDGERLMRELAGYMAQWRGKKLSKYSRIGNLRFREQGGMGEVFDTLPGPDVSSPGIVVEGLLYCHYAPLRPIHTALDYYKVTLNDALTKLEKEEVFSWKRQEVSLLVREFIGTTLPKLSFLEDSTPRNFTFTHYDFSPRNVLVSESSPLHITGLLDFEFAGFFPEEEEFANNEVNNAEDWPAESYEFFLRELETLGAKKAETEETQKKQKETCLLMALVGDIAPWFLREGGVKGEELEKELEEAAERVRRGIEKLGRLADI